MQWKSTGCAIALTVALAGTTLAADALKSPANIPDYVAAAVADPVRSADAANDARRKVAEITAFAGVKPGDRVLELIPGSGYFTRVFSKVVGPKGHVYTVWPEPYAKEAGDDPTNLRQLASQSGYENISVAIQPVDAMKTPKPVDVVFTSQNYHDYPDKFMGPTDPAILNRDAFAALKAGGTYVIIDHVAAAGSGLRDTDTLHRIDPDVVKKQVVDAGFEFVAESDVLRNATDDHTLKVFDKAVRGHTDQFVFKFRKPHRATH